MKQEEQKIKHPVAANETIRLNKFLSDAGVCSRREADRLIAQGKIMVNGKTAVMGQKVTLQDDVVADGKTVGREQERILIAFHKPVGVECTADRSNPDNIIDYIGYPKRIYPVGRLDKNSQGLILLTNDGSLVNQILKASNYHEKEYLVTVDRPVTENFVRQMSSGIEIPTEGFIQKKKIGKTKGQTGQKKRSTLQNTEDRQIPTQVTRPCQVVKVNAHTFDIILTQGLNRQIRRMCNELGYGVQKLKRVRVMNIELGNLPMGQYRDVTAKEWQGLRTQIRDD